MTLVVVGGTVVDLILPDLTRLPTWPRHTEFTTTNLVLLKNAPLTTLGGNGANAAYVAARCGARVELHTSLGDDELGKMAEQWLVAAGCKIHPRQRSGSTAVNITAANSRHERATFFFAGADFALKPIPSREKAVRAVLVCGWPHPPLATMAKVFSPAQRRGILTALDVGPLLGPAWSLAKMKPVLNGLTLLIANQHEALKISRVATLASAWKKIRAHYLGDVVVKCGGDGVYWLPANQLTPLHVPPNRVRAVNTVGAGDSFNGALMAALLAGASYPLALRRAAQVAASVVASGRGVLGVRP